MRVLLVLVLAACVGQTPYQRVTNDWTRAKTLQSNYQQVISLAAVYKSPEWRTAYAQKDADNRGLTGAARDQRLAQATADSAGPLEFELLVTTWDRRENDLDRKKSAWRIRMLDAAGAEIEPTEIVKDKRPLLVIRSEFPSMGDFATAYIVRFARRDGPLRLRVSSERGGVEVAWAVR
jgi:hypothetical protein